MNTDWYIVRVETPRNAPSRISAAAQHQLAENLAFARELGAEVVTLKRRDIAGELVCFARNNNVTYVILGHSQRSCLEEFFRGSVINRFVRESSFREHTPAC